MRGIRLDRMLSLGLFRRVGRVGRRPGIPILMYHSVRETSEARHPYFATNISPSVFKAHLQFLRDGGYESVHLSEIVEILQEPQATRQLVAITFDDGFRNFYTQAFPLLTNYGFTATLFVPSGLVGKESSNLGPEPFMTWEEIREVSRHGVQIGSHSVTHGDLYRAHSRTLEDEVRCCKAAIEDNIGQTVRSFAFPFAFPEHDKEFCRRFAGLLEQIGYDNGVSTVIGRACRNHNRYTLPRLPINSHDDLALFAAKLDGYYDWVHLPQYAYKALKTLIKPFSRPTQSSEEPLQTPWISRL